MGQNQKARYSLALVISLSSSFAISQQQLPVNPDTRLDEERANDMRRGLSREEQRRNEEIEAVSPIRRIGRNPNPVTTEMPTDPAHRSIDGSGNNQRFSDMNGHGAPLRRWLPADYADGISALAATAVAGPRETYVQVTMRRRTCP